MVSNVYAPGFDWLGSLFGTPGWLGWERNLLIIGFIVLFGVTVLYMLAMAFNISALKTWAKGEYMQIIVTFLLAGAMLQATGVIWGVMYSSVNFAYATTNPQSTLVQQNPAGSDAGAGNLAVTGGSGGAGYYDPFEFTKGYIQTSFIDCEKNIYRAIYPINFYYKMVGKILTEPLGVEKLGGWYTGAYTGLMDYITGNINNLLLLHYIQLQFLSIIKYVMPLLIQIGLVLRVFPLTRGAGGLLLAIGFGFFVVYPISLALLTTIQAPPSASFCSTANMHPPALLSLDSPECGLDAGSQTQIRYNILATENETAGLLEKIKTFLPSFYLQAVFFPLVALTVTWSFVREFAELLAGDLNEIGRGLIKLI